MVTHLVAAVSTSSRREFSRASKANLFYGRVILMNRNN